MASRKRILHPKCGKSFADGDRTGHCATCCETFYGTDAFDRHLTQQSGGRPLHDKWPGELWWQDEDSRWHYGERLTPEEREKIWQNKPAAN